MLINPHVHLEGVGAPVPDLTKLDGQNGFVIDEASSTSAGFAGDLNGDGYDDLIVGTGAFGWVAYVVYGHGGQFPADVFPSPGGDYSALQISGGGSNLSGWSVSAAGDVNGDGFDDAIIGVPSNSPSIPGSAFVVFGSASGLGPSLDLSSLDGSNGFAVNGTPPAGNQLGWSVASAGDVNGDGYDDLLIGSSYGAPQSAGTAYLLFGHAGPFSAALGSSDFDGKGGFQIVGGSPGEVAGQSVGAAGDINGDGYDDFIVGGRGAPVSGESYAGESFVVFGHPGSFAASLDVDTLDGTNGFKILPVPVGDDTGTGWFYPSSTNVTAAGDINGDGYADLVIGVYAADPEGKTNAGSTYVVYGHAGGFGATLDLTTLDAAHGFRIDGAAAGDASGWSVANAGDVNGDGYDDLLISAHQPTALGSQGSPGAAYVVFGHAGGFGDHIDLSTLHGSAGFAVQAPAGSFGLGMTVAPAGDVNGDGFADIAISDYGAARTYVLFGADFTASVDHLGTWQPDNLVGNAGDETFVGGDGRDTIYGGGGRDSIEGGAGDDLIHVTFAPPAGESYTDLNHNGHYDFGEPFSDANLDGIYDGPGTGPAVFRHVDGGSGFDTLFFDTDGPLDFGNLDGDPTTSDRGKITNIEALSFDNGLVNDVTLHKADVLDMNPTDDHYVGNGTPERLLYIHADSQDTIHLAAADHWTQLAPDTLPGYAVYSAGGEVKVAIDAGVVVHLDGI